ALNIAQRMSGIATMTHQFVDAVSNYAVQILDTRKTIPGFRQLDKYAVKAGGGTNHRMGLYDMAMIKDNHIIAAGSIAKAVSDVRNANPDITIEVETTGIEEVQQALSAEADIIMLDNMGIEEMKQAVEIIGTKAESEASGNVTLETVKDVAATGVDYISVGALTHSVKAFDISQSLTYFNNHSK
nr:carboxylating nicotinate-nucleotide diphosphorylase [Fodinibius sp.]NIV12756.1 carboxylating nicotinate-nucleotide diphosphorylase [Fodinibius sp.]NIY26474.1 carboxylating nicotinate-nucleotide diphosphorylase [Fodinibius sp.]